MELLFVLQLLAIGVNILLVRLNIINKNWKSAWLYVAMTIVWLFIFILTLLILKIQSK